MADAVTKNFAKNNAIGLCLSMLMLGVLIASVATDVYYYESRFYVTQTTSEGVETDNTLNITRYLFRHDGIEIQSEESGVERKDVFVDFDEDHDEDQQHILRTQFAFALLALIFSFFLTVMFVIGAVASLRNKLLYSLGMNPIKMIFLALALAIFAFATISFLVVLGITEAIDDDCAGASSCIFGLNAGAEAAASVADRFTHFSEAGLGSQSVTLVNNGASVTTQLPITHEEWWGPVASWYCVMCPIPLAIACALIAIVNKFPVPTASVGYGESM